MSPANIEGTLKVSCPLAAAITVIGDGRPFNVALVTLDPDAAAAYARSTGWSPSRGAGAGRRAAGGGRSAAIAAGNARLSRVEQVKEFEMLPTFWEPGGDELSSCGASRSRQVRRRDRPARLAGGRPGEPEQRADHVDAHSAEYWDSPGGQLPGGAAS